MKVYFSHLAFPLCLVFLLSCGDDDTTSNQGTDADTNGYTVTDTDADTNGDADSKTDTYTDVDTADPPNGCSPKTAVGLRSCVDPDNYIKDINRVAVIRPPGSDSWQEIQDLCADRFADLGYEVERHDYDGGINVIGTMTGTGDPENQVIVSAHYDHIPNCPGADDNASGVAGLFEVARVLSTATYERTLIVACWDQEESGLIGSLAYAGRAVEREEKIRVAMVFEMIGYTDDAPDTQSLPTGYDFLFPTQAAALQENDMRANFLTIIGDVGAGSVNQLLKQHAEDIGLMSVILELTESQTASPLLGDLRRSDHASFWMYGYPAIMITDTSEFRYKQYHCINGDDVVALLDHEFAANVVRTTVATAAEELIIIQGK